MLIFVDKKQERRRRIKIACIVFFTLFFLTANTFHFQRILHQSTSKLTAYESHQITNDWYDTAGIVFFFDSHKNPKTKALLIPTDFNRENAETIALALSKMPNKKTYIEYTPEIFAQEEIKKLAAVFFPLSNSKKSEQKIIISSSSEALKEVIAQNQLYPLALNYKHTQKLQQLENLTEQMDALFPPKPAPTNKLEEDKLALQNFMEENLTPIKNIIFRNEAPAFNLHNILSGDIRFCLQNESKTKCKFHTKNSFATNLQKTTTKFFHQDLPHNLILLTEDYLISFEGTENINSDEGLHFVFNNNESFLFPKDINSLADKKEAIYILKEKAGFNPAYQNPTMKLYKFKILEVNLHDNI